MKIKITTEDFRNANCYTDPNNCPLATAVRRQVDADYVSCCIGSVSIKKDGITKHYVVTEKWRTDQKLYKGEHKGMCIDSMIYLAKNNPDVEFPTKKLILFQWK
jgi:hypothetical protein